MGSINSEWIRLYDIKDIRSFVNEARKFKSDINIQSSYNSRAVVDAKSIIAVLALNLSGPLKVTLLSNDDDEIAQFDKLVGWFK